MTKQHRAPSPPARSGVTDVFDFAFAASGSGGNQYALSRMRQAQTGPPSPVEVDGQGGYRYRWDPDGTITILSGPGAAAGEVCDPRAYAAIQAEIESQIATGAASMEVVRTPQTPASAPPAATEEAADPARGWQVPSLHPVGWLDDVAAVVRGAQDLLWSDDSPEVAATNAPSAEAPAAHHEVHNASLAAAQTYLPQYDDDGKLLSGVSRYGFGQARKIFDDDSRADMTQMWCSGLSTSVLDDLDHDMDAPIDGQFYYEGGRKKPVTLRQLVEGSPEVLAQTADDDALVQAAVETLREELAPDYAEAEAIADPDTRRQAIAKLDVRVRSLRSATLYGLSANFGAGRTEDDARVKGAAGAFELAGIGTEIDDVDDLRPGDFVQRRDRGRPAGHAYQLHSVLLEGSALIGVAGSPALTSAGTRPTVPRDGGSLYTTDARFLALSTTDPETIGEEAKAVQWSILESNVSLQQNDPEGDGGVGIHTLAPLPTNPDGDRRVYFGRLASSPWNTGGETGA